MVNHNNYTAQTQIMIQSAKTKKCMHLISLQNQINRINCDYFMRFVFLILRVILIKALYSESGFANLYE